MSGGFGNVLTWYFLNRAEVCRMIMKRRPSLQAMTDPPFTAVTRNIVGFHGNMRLPLFSERIRTELPTLMEWGRVRSEAGN